MILLHLVNIWRLETFLNCHDVIKFCLNLSSAFTLAVEWFSRRSQLSKRGGGRLKNNEVWRGMRLPVRFVEEKWHLNQMVRADGSFGGLKIKSPFKYEFKKPLYYINFKCNGRYFNRRILYWLTYEAMNILLKDKLI